MTLGEIFSAFRSKEADRFQLASEVLIDRYASDLSAGAVAELAEALAASGNVLQLPEDLQPYADVPSTGGPSSLSTLLCPLLLVTNGFHVPKISATGSVSGAIDTLMMIPGYRADLDAASLVHSLRAGGIAHSLQSEGLCPADRVLIEVRRQKGAMRQSRLLTASLLSKKLVVPGTLAVFDFRLGEAGNVADTLEEGREIAEFFLSVARKLGVIAAVVLTNGQSYSCSAVGRLESLTLLTSMLQGKDQPLPLDRRHVEACENIAGVAASLMREPMTHTTNQRCQERVKSAWQVFCAHLEAQGAGHRQLNTALEMRTEQHVDVTSAREAGYWVPPDLQSVKAWIKRHQSLADEKLSNTDVPVAARQIGLRLLSAHG